MIRSILMTTLALALGTSCSAQKGGWIKLFNGKDLKDWDIKITGHALNDNNGNTFRVKDGALAVSYENYDAFNDQYGHIFHKKKFSAYLLVMEYRFVGDQVKGGPGWATRNSGAMIHSQSAASMGKDQDFPISIEVQLLGGLGHGKRSTANLCTPGTNVVMDGKLITAHCVDSKSETYDGDRWVRAEVLVLGDSIVKHIVEGDTVLTYNKPQIGGGNVSHADPKLQQNDKLLSEGYIALQSESHPVEYRKVDLFDLAPYMKDKKKLAKKIEELQKRKK
ncbi:3-keto-disaccharide hydrolase [Chitinophaga sp. NPDC101104]|uniref:3-keto-disaccharide hydrolase n=1 Tax=Chitinophaga sp. NPDC101104 TaxID=3390561 RepID=UPI003D04F374